MVPAVGSGATSPDRASARLIEVLGCAALHPGLRGLILFDATPADLGIAAEVAATMLAETTERQVLRVRLGADVDEDRLWSQFLLHPMSGRIQLELLPGPLVEVGAASIPLVIIPDLAELGVVGQRAGVALVGADTAVIARHGRLDRWRPSGLWLAACPATAAGRVSPHLLDRFPLRMSASLAVGGTGRDITAAPSAEDLRNDSWRAGDQLAAGVVGLRGARAAPWPSVSAEVSALIAARADEPLFGHTDGLRGMIALGRLAVACARWRGTSTVSTDDVVRATALLGDRPPKTDNDSHMITDAPDQAERPDGPDPRTSPTISGDNAFAFAAPGHGLSPTATAGGVHTRVDDQARLPGGVESVGRAAHLPPVVAPVPTDGDDPHREVDSLRLPWSMATAVRAARGRVIGSEPTIEARDIAIVPTLLAAATMQTLRTSGRPADPDEQGTDMLRAGSVDSAGSRRRGIGLVVQPTDLRAYRRATVPGQLLVLVVDHTARRGPDWSDLLLPYVSWAYVQRLPVCLIEVGVTGAAGSPVLRARQLDVHTVLDPQLGAAFAAPAGAASPLAHGLELALQTLRHALRHGSALVGAARLVVATDGRGNVPLVASRRDRVDGVVSTQGVDDTLAVAADIAALSAVRSEVVDLAREPYQDLPLFLARALRGTLREPASVPSTTDDRRAGRPG